MINILKKDRWSPYLVGAMIGIVLTLVLYLSNNTLGTSTTFVKAGAFIESIFSKNYVLKSEYYSKYLKNKPFFSFQQIFVLAIFFGSWAAARLSSLKRVEYVPSIWQERFGPSKKLRYLGAFIGGMIILFGARISAGCTSGHAISGGSQLAISAWIFMGAMFMSGVLTAKLMYKK